TRTRPARGRSTRCAAGGSPRGGSGRARGRLLLLNPGFVPRHRVELGRDRFVAARTDAVAELRIGMFGDVAFDLLPVLIVAANPLAVAADRQQAAQLLDVGQRGL